MIKTDLAHLIDHTLLKSDCSSKDIEQLCQEAIKYQFAAVCVPPFFVKKAVQCLKEHSVKIATVVGFPMGYSCTPAKVEEVKRAVIEGADEIDVVVNICAIKENNWSYVQNDINSMTTAAQMRGRIIKVIFETSLLSPTEIKKLCQICNDIGVNYVKTSTGFNNSTATASAVSLMRKHLHKDIKIKASGGIRDKATAEQMIAAGADRLGCSASIKIIED